MQPPGAATSVEPRAEAEPAAAAASPPPPAELPGAQAAIEWPARAVWLEKGEHAFFELLAANYSAVRAYCDARAVRFADGEGERTAEQVLRLASSVPSRIKNIYLQWAQAPMSKKAKLSVSDAAREQAKAVVDVLTTQDGVDELHRLKSLGLIPGNRVLALGGDQHSRDLLALSKLDYNVSFLVEPLRGIFEDTEHGLDSPVWRCAHSQPQPSKVLQAWLQYGFVSNVFSEAQIAVIECSFGRIRAETAATGSAAQASDGRTGRRGKATSDLVRTGKRSAMEFKKTLVDLDLLHTEPILLVTGPGIHLAVEGAPTFHMPDAWTGVGARSPGSFMLSAVRELAAAYGGSVKWAGDALSQISTPAGHWGTNTPGLPKAGVLYGAAFLFGRLDGTLAGRPDLVEQMLMKLGIKPLPSF